MTTLHFNPLVPPFDLGEGTATEELEKANILTYGADSTGVEASDKALKEASEESKIIYAPKGTYLFNEAHKFKGQYVIYGDGQMLTTFKTNATNPCSIIEFENPGCQIHDLKLEGPLTGPTEGVLLAFKEGVLDESELVSATPKAWTEARHITTVGGFSHILLNKLTGAVIKDWVATEVRKFGLYCVGTRPTEQCNLVYVSDVIISGKKEGATVPGSVAVKIEAGEAITVSKLDTEFCEVGMEVGAQTENSWFTDCFFDFSQGTGVILGNVKGINFDKVWSNSTAVGGGILIGKEELVAENCTFSNCWFFSNTGEIEANSAIWKEISETEYNALASKKAEWKRATAYVLKDGVFHTPAPEEFPVTGGGKRYYENIKATKVLSPRLSGGLGNGFPTYAYQELKATYALKDAVQEGAKFYENIKAITPESEATSARKPTGTEGGTFWKEVTEAEFREGDFLPVGNANGMTIGPGAKEISVIGCGIRLAKNNAIQLERAGVVAEQNFNLIGCQMNEYKGFGLRIGHNQENVNILGNAFISLEGRGSIANDTVGGFVVFNTGASEFLTSVMGKPAIQPALLNEVVSKPATGAAFVKAQFCSYETKKETETKIKHNLNSTAILSVVAYKYPASKLESKMQLATKTVSEFTVNSASEITIKWSAELAAKEQIAIVIQAA